MSRTSIALLLLGLLVLASSATARQLMQRNGNENGNNNFGNGNGACLPPLPARVQPCLHSGSRTLHWSQPVAHPSTPPS